LVAGGVAPLGAEALVSRWKNVESPGGPNVYGGYKGRAFGIGQWLGDRRPEIVGNADIDAQVDYALKELKEADPLGAKNAMAVLNAAKTSEEAARGASIYERAGNFDPLTGRDDYTKPTAAGIPGVHSAISGVGAVGELKTFKGVPYHDFHPEFSPSPVSKGISEFDPTGFRDDIKRRAQQQGSWSNSTTNNNVNMGGQKTTINIDGSGMDSHALVDMIGRKQVRVNADFLRNAKSAIA